MFHIQVLLSECHFFTLSLFVFLSTGLESCDLDAVYVLSNSFSGDEQPDKCSRLLSNPCETSSRVAHYLAMCVAMGRSAVGFDSDTWWHSLRIVRRAKSCSFHQLCPNDLELEDNVTLQK